MTSEAFALNVLMYFVVPLWIAAGAIDWWCHRRTDIEHTAGPKESLIHLLMFAELGLPMVAALLLEINALVIAFMILMFFVHEATALWDVSYAVSKREVSPIEQHVHSYLELVPLMGLILVAVTHHEQFLALFGAGNSVADFTLAVKTEPLPVLYLSCVFAASAAFSFLPYVLELRRGLRAKGEGLPSKSRSSVPAGARAPAAGDAARRGSTGRP